MKIGASTIAAMYVGGVPVSAAYLGGVQVFGGAAPFNPTQLFASGEQGAWYDPSDLSTMFTDTAGTTPAAVGDPVARINDKSGRGNHATQATAAARPILRQTAGGLYYLEFDGVDDTLATATLPEPGVDKAQVFAGVRKLSDTGRNIVELSSGIGTNNGAINLQANGLATRSRFVSKGTTASTADDLESIQAPTTLVLTGLGDISGGLATLRRDGTEVTQNTGTQGTGNYLAHPLFIGSRNQATFFFDGHIYSLIVRFGSNLDAATIEDVEGFVSDKTGVEI